ncbi:MAG: hypothetical protein R3C26_16575 [Calditrichia bacterium]
MKVRIKRVDDAFHFLEASGASGVSVHIDGSSESGDIGFGRTPDGTVADGLGGCSAFDVVLILKKQRQPLKDIRIEVIGDRSDRPNTFGVHQNSHALPAVRRIGRRESEKSDHPFGGKILLRARHAGKTAGNHPFV